MVCRDQGFRSPQLHQAQRIGSTPTQGRLSADHFCDGLSTLSADRFRWLRGVHDQDGHVQSHRLLIVGRLQRWSWTAEDCSARSTVELVADELGRAFDGDGDHHQDEEQ
jgi:hypothetical protein